MDARFDRVAALAAIGLVLLLPLATGIAAAQTGSQGVAGTVVVEEGETVDGIDAVAGTVVVRGTVTGDLSGAAGSIRVAETGQVEGTLDASAGSILIQGTVEGDVRGGGGSFELTETGRIGGSLDVGAGSVLVDGTVGGDVRAAGGSVTLGPNADVAGEFRYDADDFTESPDATVAGGVEEDPSLSGDRGGGFGGPSLPSWLGPVYWLGANLLLGVLLLGLFPRFSADVAARVSGDPVTTGGIGLATLVAVPIVLLLAAITVLGLPLSLAGLGVALVGAWVAAVYGQYAVGRWAIGLADRENRWLALVAGVAGFAVLGLVPVLGGLLEFLAFLLGVGALVAGLRERYRRAGDDGGLSTVAR